MEKKLNILIANDDGICAPGIERLARAALPFGNVWVAAPESQCSGMSQKITIRGEIRAEKIRVPGCGRGRVARVRHTGRLRERGAQGAAAVQAGRGVLRRQQRL